MLTAECFFASLNFEHAIKRYPRPMLDIISHFDLIDDIAFRQILQSPAQMLRRDAEHGGAQTTRIVERDDLLPFRSEFLSHTVDQVDLGAYGKHGAGGRVADHPKQAFSRPNPVSFLAHFQAALGMNNDADSRKFCANVIHMFRKEALVH